MAEISQEERDRIVKVLESKGATKPCPRCGNNSFALVSGYFNHFIQTNLSGVSIGGPGIPTAVVICSNCGWLAEHALGALDLLPKQPEKPKTEGSP
jgi:ribosomal protein S27AE